MHFVGRFRKLDKQFENKCESITFNSPYPLKCLNDDELCDMIRTTSHSLKLSLKSILTTVDDPRPKRSPTQGKGYPLGSSRLRKTKKSGRVTCDDLLIIHKRLQLGLCFFLAGWEISKKIERG